eukprot:gene65-538_t
MTKILVVGDVKGKLAAVAKAAAPLKAKGFVAIFCVGEFSSEEMELDVELPLPTYFIDCGPAAADLISESPEGDELAPNLHFLGGYGLKELHGLQVAFLSGTESQKEETTTGFDPPSFREGKYTTGAINSLKQEIMMYRRKAVKNRVDLLLTCDWPEKLRGGAPKEGQKLMTEGAREVAQAACPRYMILSRANKFWRRDPYIHSTNVGVVRAVSLGMVGGEKWAHGLSLDTSAPPTIPDGATPNPFEMKDEDVPKTEEELAEEAEAEEKKEIQEKGSMLDNMTEEEKRAMRAKFGAAFVEMEKNEVEARKEEEREIRAAKRAREKAEEKERRKNQPVHVWRCLGETEEGLKKGNEQRMWNKRRKGNAPAETYCPS